MNHYDSRYEEGLLGESTPDYERGLCRDQYDADDETSTVYYYHWWWYNYYHYCGVGPQVGVQKNEKIPAFDEEGGFDLSEVFFLNSKSDELSLDPEIQVQGAMSSPLEDGFENVVQGVILDGNEDEYELSDDFFLFRSEQSLDSESEADLMNVVHDVLNYYEEVQSAMSSPLEDIAQAVVQKIPNEDDQKVQHNQFILTDEVGDFDFAALMPYDLENVDQAIDQEFQHYEETRNGDDNECNLSDVFFMPRDELTDQPLDSEPQANLTKVDHDVPNDGEGLNYCEEDFHLSDVFFMLRDECDEQSFGANLDQFPDPELLFDSELQAGILSFSDVSSLRTGISETLKNTSLRMDILRDIAPSTEILSNFELQPDVSPDVGKIKFNNCTVTNPCNESDWAIIIFHLIAIHNNDHIVLPKTIR